MSSLDPEAADSCLQQAGEGQQAMAAPSTRQRHVTPTPVAPDGGFGWVVTAASFLIMVIVDGVCFCYGVFFTEFVDYFGASKAKTSWVGSVLNGSYMTVGKSTQ